VPGKRENTKDMLEITQKLKHPTIVLMDFLLLTERNQWIFMICLNTIQPLI
jgi:hypothetical protein